MVQQPTVEARAERRQGRRLDIVVVLVFVVMLAAGTAIFPLSVASNQLSGLWITLCAAVGLD